MSHLTVFHGGNVTPPRPRGRAAKLFHSELTVRAMSENARERVYFIVRRY